MDGPNVNWKLFRNLAKDIEDQTDRQLLNIGSCALHILHNAYKIGINSCLWDVEEVLYALHWLFKDTPARREEFCLVTGSTKFPLNYCKNRWLENVPVIERTIQIWPSIQQYVEAVHANKTLRPKNKSFTTVEHATKDLLFITKLNICLSIAQICQEFLTKYQTDAPMIPFLCDDLFKLIKRLLERFVTDNEIIKLTTPVKLFKDNFRDKFSQSNYHKDASAINVGFVAEQELKRLKLHKKISDLTLLSIKKDTKGILIAIVKKLLENFSLNYKLIRIMEWLNPLKMSQNSRMCVDQLTRCLEVMSRAGRMRADKRDKTIAEYELYLEEKKEAIAEYDGKRLDQFLYLHLSSTRACENLRVVVKKVLLLSHGQASVERGFSVNKNLLSVNMEAKSIIFRRIIVDHVRSVGGVANVQIDKEFLRYVRGARLRYEHYSESEKKKREETVETRKRKLAEEEINQLQIKRNRIETSCKQLLDSADRLALEAEKGCKMQLLVKSNAFRKSAQEKRIEVTQLDKDIQQKRNKLKQI